MALQEPLARELRVLSVLLVSRDQPDPLERRVRLVRRVSKDLPELPAYKEPQALRDRLGLVLLALRVQ